MYVNDDKSQAVVFLYGLNRGIMSDFPAPLPIQGLALDKRYRVTEINKDKRDHSRVGGQVLSGAALMGMGLPVSLEGDYDSAAFELTAE